MKSKIILLFLLICSITFLFSADSYFNGVENSNLDGLVISEVIPENSSLMADEFGNFYDIIELYNASDNSIDLTGYGLTDDPDVIHQWNFPEIKLDSGEYLLVFAAGSDYEDYAENSNYLYSNFKLDKDGGKLILSDNKGKILSSLAYQQMKSNMSYGISSSGYDYYLKGSPLESNNNTIIKDMNDFMKDFKIEATLKGGIYDQPIEVSFINKKDYVIRYTLDSSDPTSNSLIYSEPIEITYTDDLESNIANIPTSFYPLKFIDDEFINMGQVVKAQYFDNDIPIGEMFTATYFVWEEGSDRYSMDVISLTSDYDNLYSEDDGINVVGDKFLAEAPEFPYGATPANYNQRGKEWERPANIEIFNSEGQEILNQDIGIRIAGDWSRMENKKSFRIFARDEYGEESIDLNLFDNLVDNQGKEIDSFNKLVLRTGASDYALTIFRDLITTELASDILLAQAYKPSILFLNGEYYGIYNVRENIDEYYLENHYGIDHDEVNIIKYTTRGQESDAGDKTELDRYNEFLEFINQNDLSIQSNYDYVTSMMDIDNFIEYYILEMYVNNLDWVNNNVRIWRYSGFSESGLKDGKYRFLIYDTDSGYGKDESLLSREYDSFEFLTNHENPLFRKLMENEQFKGQFLTRLADRLNNSYSKEKASTVVDNLEEIYSKEIEENYQRWNQGDYDSVADWSEKAVGIVRSFIDVRADYLLDYAIANYGLENIVHYQIESLNNGSLLVNDNYEINSSSTNNILRYFSEYLTSFEAIADETFEFSHWIINDSNGNDGSSYLIHGTVDDESIVINSDVTLEITPVFVKK